MTFTPGIALDRSVVPSVDASSETITSSCSPTWAQTDSSSVTTELQRLNAGIAILSETCFTEHSEITDAAGSTDGFAAELIRGFGLEVAARITNGEIFIVFIERFYRSFLECLTGAGRRCVKASS